MLNDSRIQKNRKREKAITLALVIDYIRSTSFNHASGPLSANLRRQVFRGMDLIDAGQVSSPATTGSLRIQNRSLQNKPDQPATERSP